MGKIIKNGVEYGGAPLPIASANVLGGVKVGNNLSIDPDGTLNATGGGGGSVDPNTLMRVSSTLLPQFVKQFGNNAIKIKFEGDITSMFNYGTNYTFVFNLNANIDYKNNGVPSAFYIQGTLTSSIVVLEGIHYELTGSDWDKYKVAKIPMQINYLFSEYDSVSETTDVYFQIEVCDGIEYDSNAGTVSTFVLASHDVENSIFESLTGVAYLDYKTAQP